MNDELLFTKEHEWIKVEGNIAYIGITHFAQSELGDIIFIELPAVDEAFSSNDVFGTIEAVKTVADLFMPIESKILEINSEVEGLPELINKDAQGKGWIVKVEIQDLDEVEKLLSLDDYKKIISNE